MELRTELHNPHIMIAAITGRFDRAAIEAIKEEQKTPSIWKLEETVKSIIVDLSLTDFIDSSGLAALVNAAQITRREGGKLVILKPSRQVRMILESTRMDKALTIKRSLKEALAVIGEPPSK
jgi:anti-anti-sigma factor